LPDTDKNRLTDEIPAHSGKYCCKVDSVIPFSYGISRYIKDITNDKIKKIKVKSWVLMPVISSEVNLVVEIKSDGKMEFYMGKSIKDFILQANKWTEASFEVDIPDKISKDSFLKVYLWSANKSVAYLDNLEVTIE
jgi:hypothetical protein